MAIHRCRDCNSTVKADETSCWACGSAIERKDVASGLGSRFAKFINFFFVVSLVITVASMFTDMMPPFMRCAAVSLVLFLVKSSAGQMAEKERKKS